MVLATLLKKFGCFKLINFIVQRNFILKNGFSHRTERSLQKESTPAFPSINPPFKRYALVTQGELALAHLCHPLVTSDLCLHSRNQMNPRLQRFLYYHVLFKNYFNFLCVALENLMFFFRLKPHGLCKHT